jgi:hypothetical protein
MAVIAVDFDGTCVTHEYPNVGLDVGASTVLKDLIAAGHKLILWTMRSGDELEQAKAWFAQKGILLYGVNTNPTQFRWTKSKKAYANLYIDDAALGIPLKMRPSKCERPYVNWKEVRVLLENLGYLNKA